MSNATQRQIDFDPAASYYNTTGEEGDNLNRRKCKANSQEAIILDFFAKHRDKGFTPREVYQLLNWKDHGELTSLRRGITNLTTKGRLRKTGERRTGEKGHPELIWKFNW